MTRFFELQERFLKLEKAQYIDIVENFCNRNELKGIDGIHGLLSYAKKLRTLYSRTRSEKIDLKSFFELSFALWALEIMGRIDIADNVAKNLENGGAFGDTCSYLTESNVNYFRSFESEIMLALRLLEGNQNFRIGGLGAPDFILEDLNLSIEVKTPSSKLGLFQALLKGVKQIEKYKYNGIIILILDHMVAREIIKNSMNVLPIDIQQVILTGLPKTENFRTIGAIAEWVKWDEDKLHPSTIMPLAHREQLAKRENLLRECWRLMTIDNIFNQRITSQEVEETFPFENELIINLDPKIEGEAFFRKKWGL
ncbi:hypothetical protein K8O68_09905 [Salipaludibacillus sp. CUR1]|uniref:hypothetical protein n=1 Tax=Salipaludibacillus sp. CUR1 TaxID=2820003 RepID=UPI001E522980|nr:hypothetical protein [Salipaludibacillus sp. CUR1]MCE7792729.1 hypothetical protein [Salipaludibacillus sp. CUR1]